MTDIATLRALAAGQAADGLLHMCRLAAFGVELYGVPAILEGFRAAPLQLAADCDGIELPGHLAIVDGDRALIADVGEGGIARMWRLGPGLPGAAEPRIDVAFDPALTQAGSGLAFAASDHPALAPAGVARVLAIGDGIPQAFPDGRSHVFVVRAFGDDAHGAALFAVHRLGPGPVRSAGFVHVAALWRDGDVRIVRDAAGEAAIAVAAGRHTPDRELPA
ncbi:hypothetical protein [Sandarakinorhabdus sp. DWP1-3-1]|uniref:hypothetical protein n=1 Tax=Sandarakinorhabdus sp. DWP1-3-1 TaxID=2804627 RepID=UPI003CF292D1